MHRPNVLDQQDWPEHKSRTKSRKGLWAFFLLMLLTGGFIAANPSTSRIEAKVNAPPADKTIRPEPTFVPFQSPRTENEISSAPAPGVVTASRSAAERSQLSGGILQGKEVRTLSLTVQSSLTFSVCRIVAEDRCRALAAHIARKLSWFLDVNREIRQGDKVVMIYQDHPEEDKLIILKLKYFSEYLNKALEMNYFKTPRMDYGSYFDDNGREMTFRLTSDSSPIRDYSEITALPGEMREGHVSGHAGTDFKASVGTPVFASFNGKVTRVNWNTRRNGYCVEIDHADKGVKTLYLHLDKALVRPGQRVRQGAKIGLSGNTGRSYAPHLHYEIKSRDQKKTVYNPFIFKYHKKYSRTISDTYRKDFDRAVRLYDSLLQAS